MPMLRQCLSALSLGISTFTVHAHFPLKPSIQTCQLLQGWLLKHLVTLPGTGEGAHATFAPRGWRQSALNVWITTKLGHTEIEEVACGRGLELLYEFLLADSYYHRPDGLPKIRKVWSGQMSVLLMC